MFMRAAYRTLGREALAFIDSDIHENDSPGCTEIAVVARRAVPSASRTSVPDWRLSAELPAVAAHRDLVAQPLARRPAHARRHAQRAAVERRAQVDAIPGAGLRCEREYGQR